MFRNLLQHVTGMVSMVRKRLQKLSGPSKGKKTPTRATATKSTKKPTKRQKASVRVVKKA
jgi:hypothetical protein